MAEIDSLEISIQSNIDKVNKNMDLLIQKMGTVARGISAIGSNKGLDEFIKSTKTASESMGNIGKNVSQSVKPIEGQMQKIAKTFEQVGEPFKDLGKGFKVSGGIADIQKSIQKYENELERAKLKEQELSAGGKTNTEGYRTAVSDVIKYRNVVESLKEQLKSVKALEAKKVEIPIKDLSIEEFTTRIRKQIDQSLAGLRIENPISIGDMSDEQFSIFKKLNEEAGKSRNSMSGVDEELEKIGKTAENTGNAIRNSAQSFKYSASAMELVFGKEYATIENFQQMAEKFNVKSGGQLGAALSDSFSNAETKAQSLKEKFSGLVVPEIKEDNLKKLQSALKRTEEEIDRLRAKLSNEITMGRMTESVDDKKFAKLSEQIALAEKKAEALRAKISELGGGGENGKVESLSKSFSKVSSAGKRLSKTLSDIVNSLKKFAKGVVSVFSRIGKLAKSMLLLGSATKKSNGGFNLGLKTILKYGFGIRSLYILVNKLKKAVREGMENLIQYSEQTNISVSTLNSSLNQFKNASAAAFAPILNAIAPALNQLIQLLISATNAVNQFLSALTGHGTWIKAKYNYEDVADKISGAEDAAKGALQPFDKLNNLTTQKNAGGGVVPDDMFETLPVEDKFKDLANWMKDMWDNADFYDLGRKLGEELQHALANIPWNKIKETARKLGKSLATLINGFVEVEGLGKAIGYSIAQALNTAYEFANSFVHSLNWESIGKFIAETINGFTQNIDWELIRDTLITGAKGLADAINSFVDYLDWDAVANTISNSVNALADTIIMFFERTDWSELGHRVGYTLEKSIEDIDFERVGRALADILQSALDFASGVIAELDWGEIKSAIKDLLTGFFGNITIPDNLKGIITALVGIEGAVLSLKGVMGTAKLAKSFSDIWDASKKLQKLKVPKIFTDIKGAFLPFADAFKQFKNSFAVSGDLFASFKNGFSSLSSGLEAFRAGLSPVTKGVVGLTAVFAEFKIVGNAFDDIIKGTGNLSTSIGKIVAAAGAAATALSVVFGIPAGIIIAGVTAAVAGLKSLNDHFNELEVERLGNRIQEAFSNPGGVSFDSIVDQYGDVFAQIRGNFTNLSDQAAQVDLLDDSITNVYRDIDQIKTSMDAGVLSVDGGVQELSRLFGELETITSEKFGAIEGMLTSAFGEGGAYAGALDGIEGGSKRFFETITGIKESVLDEIQSIRSQMEVLDPTSEEYKALDERLRILLNYSNSVEDIANKLNIDLSNINLSSSFSDGKLNDSFKTNLESLGSIAKSTIDATADATEETVAEIQTMIDYARKEGMEKEARYLEEVKENTITQGNEITKNQISMVKSVSDSFQEQVLNSIPAQIEKLQEEWEKLSPSEKTKLKIVDGIRSQGDYVKQGLIDFKENTVDEVNDEFEAMFAEVGETGAGYASETMQKMIDGFFTDEFVTEKDFFGGTVGTWQSTLNSNFDSLFESIMEENVPKAEETGLNIGNGLSTGMSESAPTIVDGAKKVMELAIKAAKETAGVHSPSTVFAEIGKNLMLGLSNGVNQNSSGVLQRLRDFVSKLKNPFNGISESFVSVGRNLMSGLKNGISSMATSVYNKISEIGNGISSKMRKVLDIHSPSRVMFELGDFTMQGFQNGLESLYNPIISSVKSFGSNLTVASAMGIDKSYMDYGRVSQYIPEYQPYQSQGYQRSEQTVQSDSELKALLRENNSLLQAILEKPIMDDDMSFQSSRRGYQAEKNRQYGKSGTTLPVWG